MIDGSRYASLPARWRSWLTEAPGHVSDIPGEDAAALARPLPPVIATACLGLVVGGLAFGRHGTMPVQLWAGAGGAIAVAWVAVVFHVGRAVSARGARIPAGLVDLLILSELLWAAQLGLGALLCMISGDPVLALYGTVLAFGCTGGLDLGSPAMSRLASAKTMLVLLPFWLGAALSPEPAIHGLALVLPVYLWGATSLRRRRAGERARLLAAQSDLRQSELRDPMTGLPNRRRFDHDLAAAFGAAGGETIFVIALGLDGLPAVAERHGRRVADQVLTQAAERLRYHVPLSATMARLDGGHVMIVARRLTAGDVDVLAEALIAALGRPFACSGSVEVRIGASLGIVAGRAGIDDPAAVCDRADEAMRTAGRAGKSLLRHDAAAEDPSILRENDGRIAELRTVLARMRAASPAVGSDVRPGQAAS